MATEAEEHRAEQIVYALWDRISKRSRDEAIRAILHMTNQTYQRGYRQGKVDLRRAMEKRQAP
jgi:hypothetical protein